MKSVSSCSAEIDQEFLPLANYFCHQLNIFGEVYKIFFYQIERKVHAGYNCLNTHEIHRCIYEIESYFIYQGQL